MYEASNITLATLNRLKKISFHGRDTFTLLHRSIMLHSHPLTAMMIRQLRYVRF
jgi:hypothetical protein